jgi:hypothetical protein
MIWKLSFEDYDLKDCMEGASCLSLSLVYSHYNTITGRGKK